jgi:hypothetical protein
MNLFSAPLCIIEYFGAKYTIKNKLLFYTMIYTLLFSISWILAAILTSSSEDRSFVIPFLTYAITMTVIGIVLNFIAWKTNIKEMSIFAGIVYVLGGFTIISAIICFIRSKSMDEKYITKNKLLFYTMLCTLLFSIMFHALIFVSNAGAGELGVFVYTLITSSIGIVFNFIAWKTNMNKLKIIAGVFYVLGIFTIPSAIICFICSRRSRKLMNLETTNK